MEKNNVLFRYLSMAFPHGVKISKFIENPEIVTYISEPHLIKALHFDYVTIEDEPFENGLPDIVVWSLAEIKPYLRPMESMTEKEKEELKSKCIHTETEEDREGIRCDVWGILILDKYDTSRWDNPIWPSVINMDAIVWLLENHFDFLGLIPKGLAIEINEENNPYKK